MALSLAHGNCNEEMISIELKYMLITIQQQFHLTYDSRIVSAACPDKFLTADCPGGKLEFRGSKTDSNNNQMWKFTDEGTISSVECVELQLSVKKTTHATLESFFFALVNPSTKMAMDVGQTCQNGTNITLQEAVPGLKSQQFFTRPLGQQGIGIVSLACPSYVIAENPFEPSGDPCNHSNIQLRSQFDEHVSVNCVHTGADITENGARINFEGTVAKCELRCVWLDGCNGFTRFTINGTMKKMKCTFHGGLVSLDTQTARWGNCYVRVQHPTQLALHEPFIASQNCPDKVIDVVTTVGGMSASCWSTIGSSQPHNGRGQIPEMEYEISKKQYIGWSILLCEQREWTCSYH